MSAFVLNSWTTLKSVISKLVFLLGLATAFSLSFSGIKNLFGGDSPAGSTIEGTPRTVQQFGLSGSSESRSRLMAPPSLIPVGADAPPKTADAPPKTSDAAPQGAALDAAPANPEAPGEAPAAGNDGIPEGQPGEFIAPAMPYAFDPGMGSDPSPSRTADPLESKDPLAGGIGGGMGALGAMGGSGFSGFSSGASSHGGIAGKTLNPQDLQLLSTPLKAVFSDLNWKVSGVHYPAGEASSSTSPVTEFPVSLTRWNLAEGVRQDGTLSISGPNQNNLSFVLGLYFQAQGATTWQSFTAGTGVISTTVRSEVRSGHPFRVFEFKLASFQIRPGEVLRQVSVLLAMDVSSPGSPQVSNESRIRFVRTATKASSVAWPSPVNPASDPYVIAEEIPYSIELQNAP